MVECAEEYAYIELCIVGYHEIRSGEIGEEFLRYGRKFRRRFHVFGRDAMDFNEIIAEEVMSCRRTDKPVPGIEHFSVIKDGDPCSTDAGVRVVRGFKIEAGELHAPAFRSSTLLS